MTAQKRPVCNICNIETENSVMFGAKWTAAGVGVALSILAGCDNFLPKETPRYNTVIGERRAPALNGELLAQSQAPQTAAPVPLAPAISAAPAAPTPRPAPAPEPAPFATPSFDFSATPAEGEQAALQAPVAHFEATTPPEAPSLTPTLSASISAPSTATQAEPIITATASTPQQDGILGQLSGWFSDEPTSHAAEEGYPELQPTHAAPNAAVKAPEEPAAFAAASQHRTVPAFQDSDIEANIRSLEHELSTSAQEQQALQTEGVPQLSAEIAPPAEPATQPTAVHSPEITAPQRQASLNADAPQQAASFAPALLPPPPAAPTHYQPPSFSATQQAPAITPPRLLEPAFLSNAPQAAAPAPVAVPNLSQQPLPEHAFNAPAPVAVPNLSQQPLPEHAFNAPAPAATPNLSQQPLPEHAFNAPAPAATPNLSQQPLPEHAFNAPAPHEAQPAWQAAQAPAAVTANIVPFSPPVQASFAAPAYQHSGLTPPDLSEEYGAGYLPASRYRSRR